MKSFLTLFKAQRRAPFHSIWLSKLLSASNLLNVFIFSIRRWKIINWNEDNVCLNINVVGNKSEQILSWIEHEETREAIARVSPQRAHFGYHRFSPPFLPSAWQNSGVAVGEKEKSAKNSAHAHFKRFCFRIVFVTN